MHVKIKAAEKLDGQGQAEALLRMLSPLPDATLAQMNKEMVRWRLRLHSDKLQPLLAEAKLPEATKKNALEVYQLLRGIFEKVKEHLFPSEQPVLTLVDHLIVTPGEDEHGRFVELIAAASMKRKSASAWPLTPRLIPMPPQHQNKPSFIHPMGPPKVSQLDVFEMEEEEFKELEMLHRELVDSHNELRNEHAHLLKAHEDLIMAMRTNATNGSGKNLKRHPALGVVRLDYEYPPAPGDSDHPGSFGYDVYYRCVPGLTFEMCQSGQFTELVERRFADAIKHLEARGASAITGDCGFMMAFQVLARKIASKPIFMSSMVQCPIIAASLDPDDDILILTANSESLKPQKEILLTSCGFDVSKERFHIHGCQDVPGFEAVSLGQKGPDGRFMSTISLASNFVSCHEWAQSGKVF
eukprot:s253_g28.t2